MLERLVSKDYMASVLVLSSELEPVPEAYRGQPGLKLIVRFQDYVDFVYNCLDTQNVLATPTLKLRALTNLSKESADDFDTAMFQAFALDVSLGMYKELYYATRLGQGATRIEHQMPKGAVYTKEDITNISTRVTEYIRPSLDSRLTAAGFKFPFDKISPENKSLLHYANVLYYFSDSPLVWRVENYF